MTSPAVVAVKEALIAHERKPDKVDILTYGRWCTQKTRQIATLIEAFGKEKVFIVSCAGGLNTIEGMFAEGNRIECRSIDDLRKAWATLAGDKGPLRTIEGAWLCWDGMTEACEWIEDNAMDALDEAARAVSRGERASITGKQREWLRFVNADGGPDNQKAYGPIGTDCKMLIEHWSKRLPCNTYATAHEQETSRDRTSGPPYMPKLPGKVAREYVMGKYDYVMRMTAEHGGTAQLDPAKINFYWSRTRENRGLFEGAMPGEIRNFNLAAFVTSIRGGGFITKEQTK